MSALQDGLDLLDSKIKYLKDMKSESMSIANCIENDRFEDIEGVLNIREGIIKDIDVIDLKFDEYKTEELLNNEHIRSKISEIKDILMEIKSIDDGFEKAMASSMEISREDLKDARKNQRAMQQYIKSDPYQAFASLGGTLFIDEDS